MFLRRIFFIGIITTIFAPMGFSCTGITLKGEDGSAVFGRTLEWASFDFHSRIIIKPRNYSFKGRTPEGNNGKRWKSKYGIVGLDFANTNIIIDGMNEKGLTVNGFYYPHFAQFLKYDKRKAGNTISSGEVIEYLLSQFSTIKEVENAMQKIQVVGVPVVKVGEAVVHWIVEDKAGKAIVIEYTKGKLHIFNDKFGAITNSPSFDWHLINLQNYLHLQGQGFTRGGIASINFKPIGAGSGFLGLPGDFTPPSRFIRAVAFSQTARPTKNADETVFEVARILDNFNVPVIGKSELTSGTQWTTVWDKSKGILYYHTYHNRATRALRFSDIDFESLNHMMALPLDKEKGETIEYLQVPKK